MLPGVTTQSSTPEAKGRTATSDLLPGVTELLPGGNRTATTSENPGDSQRVAPVGVSEEVVSRVSLRVSYGSKTSSSATRAGFLLRIYPISLGLAFGRRGRYKRTNPKIKGRYYTICSNIKGKRSPHGFRAQGGQKEKVHHFQSSILKRREGRQTGDRTCKKSTV